MVQSGSEVDPEWSAHLALKKVKPRAVIFPVCRKANDMVFGVLCTPMPDTTRW